MNVEQAYEAGKSVWPGVGLGLEEFAARAREVVVSEDGLLSWPGDFYLACAAGAGDAAAVAAVDARFVTPLSGRLRRLGSRTDDLPDVLQAIRERLFAGPRPRIRAYNASAPLERWIKVVAVRAAIDLHRSEAATRRGAALLVDEPPAIAADPATDFTRQRYKTEFERVLRMKLCELPPRDRTVLRLHVIDGVSIEKIAVAHGVHRVTVARWVWKAGEIVLEGVRRHFKEQHGMVSVECDSLVQALTSQISLSLAHLLQE
jgi:RNA polymerase sigma-70 factor (ECF subfamily)